MTSNWTWDKAGGCADMHFEGICEACDVARASHQSMGEVDDRYRQGRVGQDLFEAYMHVWATSAFRYGSSASGWVTPSEIPAVIRLSSMLRKAMEATQ